MSEYCVAGYNHNTYPVCPTRLVGMSNHPPCDPRPVKIIVTGSREWDDWGAMLKILSMYPPGTILVHGDCRNSKHPWRSADRIADRLGRALDFVVVPMPANWQTEGRSAGPRRNERMVKKHRDADCVRAFPLPGGRGTQDCIRRAKDAGIVVMETRG